MATSLYHKSPQTLREYGLHLYCYTN